MRIKSLNKCISGNGIVDKGMTDKIVKCLLACGVIAVVVVSKSTKTYANNNDTDIVKEMNEIDNDNYNISLNDALNNGYWEECKDGNWIYHYCDGSIATGYFYDMNGDFYSTEPDGKVFISRHDNDGQYYGPDGKLVNYGYTDIDGFLDKCKLLESGQNVEFNTLDELFNFVEYYSKEYNLGTQTMNFKTYKKKVLNKNKQVVSTSYFINNSKNSIYNREETEKMLEERFGEPLKSESLKDKIIEVCERVKCISYDDASISISMIDALKSNKGGCWHMAKAAHFMLAKAGIYSEIVTGKSYGLPHMWLRIKDENGAWIYCDPTYYVNGLPMYGIIDYRVYKDNYRVNRFFSR